MPYGYHGKILHVVLTEGKLEVERPSEAFYRQYLGGSAMGTYYVLKNTPAHADPLGPENTLALMTGVVTGVAISGNSRVSSIAKSPLTDAIGDTCADRRADGSTDKYVNCHPVDQVGARSPRPTNTQMT